MNLFRNLQQEIDFCRRVYPGFDDVGEPMQSIFAAVQEFAGGVDSQVDAPEQPEMDELFRRGVSVRPALDADRQAFDELASIVSRGIARMYPAAEDAIWQFRDKLMATAFPDDNTFAFDDDSVGRLLAVSSDDDDVGRDVSTLIVSLTLCGLYRAQMGESLRGLNSELWDEGCCPICGQSPHFGFIRSEDGARILDCWLCGTRWSFMRIKCPHCLNNDHEELGYFQLESLDICRVYFCKGCDQYFKVFDLQMQEKEDAELFIHNLATLSVDLVARNEGFLSGSGLKWVDEEGHL